MQPMPARSTAAALLWLLSHAASAATCATWPREVYLLRHAEKLDASSESPLSVAGWQRAGGLPKALSGVEVGAILVSDTRRTQQTALAITKATDIDPQIFAQHTAQGIADLIDVICKVGREGSKAVVVVGHESTVPKIMSAIGVAPGDEKRPAFGDLYVVAHTGGSVAVDPRRYGDCP